MSRRVTRKEIFISNARLNAVLLTIIVALGLLGFGSANLGLFYLVGVIIGHELWYQVWNRTRWNPYERN